ncbi:hypothetical protein, partial [Paraburkholderia hospita]
SANTSKPNRPRHEGKNADASAKPRITNPAAPRRLNRECQRKGQKTPTGIARATKAKPKPRGFPPITPAAGKFV